MIQSELYLKYSESQRIKRNERIRELNIAIDSALARLQDMAKMDALDNEHWLVCVTEMRKLRAYFRIYCMEG